MLTIAPRFLVATSILLAREASCSFSAPSHKHWPEPPRTRQAAAISRPLAPADPSQAFIRKVFEWEHARAGMYERQGEMDQVKAGAYWADPRIHNFGNLGALPTTVLSLSAFTAHLPHQSKRVVTFSTAQDGADCFTRW